MRLTDSHRVAREQEQAQSIYSHSQRAFTLIELVTVILIVGILAVAVAPRFLDRAGLDNRGFYDQVISTVRYAQKTAIAQRQFVCVSFPTASQITLNWGPTNNCVGGVLTLPSGDFALTNNNAAFSPYPIAAFSFDCLGRLRDMNSGATCGDTVGVSIAPRIININNYATPITVERETGYVH